MNGRPAERNLAAVGLHAEVSGIGFGIADECLFDLVFCLAGPDRRVILI
jgi:hypothetical protein